MNNMSPWVGSGPRSWALASALITASCGASAAEPTLTYTVKAGDELIKMADASFTDAEGWKQVAELNRLKNPNAIQIGQVLKIPLRLLKTHMQPAQLLSTSGEVHLAGQPVQAGQLVPEGAELQTGANGSAQLQLADQTRVTLMPNTSARLTTSQIISFGQFDAKTRPDPNLFTGLISLSRGALDVLAAKLAKRATPLQVQTPTSVVGVRGTVFRVAYDDPALQNARTEVLDGLVRADSVAQKTGADLPKGTGAVLNPGVQSIKVSPLLKPPTLPISTAVYQPQAVWRVPGLAGAQRFRVQVSGFQDFSNIVLDQVVKQLGQADFSALPNGQWHLRVRGIDADTLEGFNAVTSLQVLLPDTATEPALPWQPRQPRVSLIEGQPVLQFDAQGLGASHTLLVSIKLNRPPYLRVIKALVKPAGDPISIPLGALNPAENYLINFTVTQADGATLDPVSFAVAGLAAGDLNWARLKTEANQVAKKAAPATRKISRQRTQTP